MHKKAPSRILTKIKIVTTPLMYSLSFIQVVTTSVLIITWSANNRLQSLLNGADTGHYVYLTYIYISLPALIRLRCIPFS